MGVLEKKVEWEGIDCITFRCGNSYFRIAFFCYPLIVAGHLFAVYAAYFNLDGSFPHPLRHAAVYAISALFWFLVGAWFVLACFRESMIISAKFVSQQGVLTYRFIDLRDLTRIRWGRHTHRIILHSPGGKISIWLQNFSRREQLFLIQFFRRQFPKSIQDYYRGFRTSPMIRKLREEPQEPKPSRALGFECAAMLLATSAAFFYCWLQNLGYVWLGVALALCLFGASYIWRARKRGPTFAIVPKVET